jgi:uncharacterized protein
VLQQVAQVWRERGSEVAASAEEIHARLELVTSQKPSAEHTLAVAPLQRATEVFKSAYDPHNGGFGGAPKFPQPSTPGLVLRGAKRFGDVDVIKMVLHTCERMAAGGIHDQLGGGFARYSVDAHWLVPHFEKMLYDNAQLAQLYLDAYLVSGETGHADTVRDILDYVLRDMTHPEGGFYSAEDADSEGQEGKFYCWTHDELAKLLSPEEFIVAANYFGITKEGNFVDHSHPNPLPGLNVLSVAKPLTSSLSPSDGERVVDRSREGNLDGDAGLLAAAIAKMRAVRATRVRPHLDDKILASWNGLMLGAFARAAVISDEPRYQAAAEKNLAFIREKLWDAATKTLFHRWRESERDAVQLLEAYAFLLDGVIHLYETTLSPAYLDFALELADAMLARFYDPANGGFWQSPASATDLILRVKDDYDGAEPSGNSVATLALLKLGAITGRADFQEAAVATLALFAERMEKMPQAVPYMLQALDFALQPPTRVVLVGDVNAPAGRELLRAAHSVYQPNRVVLGNTGAVEEFARSLPASSVATAFVCAGSACQPPVTEAARLIELLR